MESKMFSDLVDTYAVPSECPHR